MVVRVIFLLLFTHQLSLCLQASTGLPSVFVINLLKSLDVTAHNNNFTRPPLYSYKFFFKLPSLHIISCCMIPGETLRFILPCFNSRILPLPPYSPYWLLKLLEWRFPLTLIYSRCLSDNTTKPQIPAIWGIL